MSELLFECYCVPRVCYGVDALFSYQHNQHAGPAGAVPRPCPGGDALVVSCGYHATHILPVLSGRLCAAASQRVNVGGATVDAFMQRLLQLKYPQHGAAVTLTRAEVHRSGSLVVLVVVVVVVMVDGFSEQLCLQADRQTAFQ